VIVCSCNVLSCRQIKSTIASDGSGPKTAGEAYDCLGCSPDCGRCARAVRSLLAEARAACASQCSSCASREIDCAVHVSVGLMLAEIETAGEREAA
jgi:bacterioferritin-associated ferredoxin